MGYLYHVHYFEYCEWARAEWIRQIYVPYKRIEEMGMALVVVEAQLRYHQPAYYDDLLTVSVAPESWRRGRFTLAYSVNRHDNPSPIFTATTSHCFIDKQGKPIPIPSELTDRVRKLYGEIKK